MIYISDKNIYVKGSFGVKLSHAVSEFDAENKPSKLRRGGKEGDAIYLPEDQMILNRITEKVIHR